MTLSAFIAARARRPRRCHRQGDQPEHWPTRRRELHAGRIQQARREQPARRLASLAEKGQRTPMVRFDHVVFMRLSDAKAQREQPIISQAQL